jgi:hypothetical protein
VSERWFFRIVFFLSIALSIGGVAFAIFYSKHDVDGQRGGAIADIIALAALFGTRNYAAGVYEALTRESIGRRVRIFNLTKSRNNTSVTVSTAIPLEAKIKGLEARLGLEAQGQVKQNIWLALSTTVGTAFWGFGDIFVHWFM